MITPDLSAQQLPDTTDIPEITQPAYSMNEGPAICIDAAHNNLHRLTIGYALYNVRMAAVISAKGRRDKSYPGYYIQLSHEKVSVFGGAYILNKESLQKVREAIVQNSEAFSEIYNDKIFREKYGRIQGEKHKRVPKEFTEATQLEPYIANKQFFFAADMEPTVILKENFDQIIFNYFAAGKKTIDFLIKAMC